MLKNGTRRFLYFLLVLFGTLSSIMVVTANASIQNYNWIGAEYGGYDSFYGTQVIAFKTGSSASLSVNVYNDFWPKGAEWYVPISISKVMVTFDWGVSYTSTQVSEVKPVIMSPFEIRTFKIDFIIPNEAVASNLLTHSYTITVEHIGTDTRLLGSWTKSGFNFVVYSNNQAAAKDSHQTLMALFNITTSSLSSDSLKQIIKARNQTAIGEKNYSLGNFAQAMEQFEAALNTINKALSMELSDLEKSKMGFYNSFVIISGALVIIGVGVILIGVGTIRNRGKKE